MRAKTFASITVFLQVSFEVQRRAFMEAFKLYCAPFYPDLICYFLRFKFSGGFIEGFSGLFFNQQDELVAFEDLFYGSVDNINTSHQNALLNSIVRNAKRYSASRVIMARNSLFSEASLTQTDIELTRWLIKKLHLTKVFLLDHWIMDENTGISLAKQGLI